MGKKGEKGAKKKMRQARIEYVLLMQQGLNGTKVTKYEDQ